MIWGVLRGTYPNKRLFGVTFMKIISFYTKDTIYEKEVEDLKSSCESLKVDHYIEERPSLGSWEKNCGQKPLFLYECLERFQKPVLWVDADGILLKAPSLSLLKKDMAFYFNDRNLPHVRSATIYAAPTKRAKKFLLLWHRRTQEELKSKKLCDQTTLNALLQEKVASLCLGELPLEYMHIFDRDSIPLDKSVILHFQASRSANMEPLFWKKMKGSELKAMRMQASFNRFEKL